MAVDVKPVPGPKPSFDRRTPVALFDSRMVSDIANPVFQYDVTADGKRFLISTVGVSSQPSSPALTVVVNWNSR